MTDARPALSLADRLTAVLAESPPGLTREDLHLAGRPDSGNAVELALRDLAGRGRGRVLRYLAWVDGSPVEMWQSLAFTLSHRIGQ